jgi:hypothetical protein
LRGHDVDTVAEESLKGRDDFSVWAAAQAESWLFITQDLDFSDIHKFVPGCHFGLLRVRLAHPGRRALASRVGSLIESEPIDEWARCFVVAIDRKIRVRLPSG